MTGRCSSCSGTTRPRARSANPSAEAVLREINGTGPDGSALSAYTELAADGSTACGCWIYCGCFADEVNQPARRRPGSEQTWVAPEWGWAWPANRRILYNRASADPDGRPWSERKRYVWWDEADGKWTGEDVPDFQVDKRPDYVPPEGSKAQDAIAGMHPFIMQAGRPGLALRALRGWSTARCRRTTSRTSRPSRTRSTGSNRTRHGRSSTDRGIDRNPSNGRPGAGRYPYVMTTYRLTEHHTAGGMTRFVPYLAELQPEMFFEVSPELAAERGLEHGGWATVSSERAAIEARVLVTERMAPAQCRRDGRCTRSACRTTGARAASRRRRRRTTSSRSSSIRTCTSRRSRRATCDIRPGRAPRGARA